MSRFSIGSAIDPDNNKVAYYIIDKERKVYLWHSLKLKNKACDSIIPMTERNKPGFKFKTKYKQGWYKTQTGALLAIQKFEEKCAKNGLHSLNPYAPGTRDAEVWEEGYRVASF